MGGGEVTVQPHFHGFPAFFCALSHVVVHWVHIVARVLIEEDTLMILDPLGHLVRTKI